MTSTRLALLLFLAGAVVAAACAPGPPAPTPAVSASWRDGDITRRVVVRSGEVCEIALEANPTTGYEWTVAQPWDEALLELVSRDFEAASRAVGSQGTQRWRFAARAAGQTTLALAYRRPWEAGVAPLATLTVTVAVAPASEPRP